MGLSAAALVPLITTAAAGAANYINQRNFSNDRQNVLLDAMRRKREDQAAEDQQTADLIHKVASSTPQQSQAQYQQALNQVLSANQPHATAALPQPGAVSGAYQGQAAGTAQQIHDYGTGQAHALASLAAPKLERQNEGYAMQHYQEGLNQLARRLRGENWLTHMRYKDIRPNPWVAALGSMAMGVANAYGANAGSKKPKLPKPGAYDPYGMDTVPGAMIG